MIDVLKPRTLLSAVFTNFLVLHLQLYQALHLPESTKYIQLEAEIPETAKKNAHPNSSSFICCSVRYNLCFRNSNGQEFITCSVPVDCLRLVLSLTVQMKAFVQTMSILIEFFINFYLHKKPNLTRYGRCGAGY